jgi:hypothetical protein
VNKRLKTYKHKLEEFGVYAVRTSNGRLWIAISISKEDIDKGQVDTDSPGIKLFGGPWYGTNLRSHLVHGKMVDPKYIKPEDLILVFSSSCTELVSDQKRIKAVL